MRESKQIAHYQMLNQEPWGYGGYGPDHMIIWIVLVIAFVIGGIWRSVRAQRQSRR
jgi:hypothetical protein